MKRVHWQLHFLPGRVTSRERGRAEICERRERMGGRQRMQHVLISVNKGVVSLFFSYLLFPSTPEGERCWLFAQLLSCGRQNGLLGNLSGQMEELSAASSFTVFPPLVFTFCLFAEWETWTPFSLCSLPSSSPLILPTTLSFVFLLFFVT